MSAPMATCQMMFIIANKDFGQSACSEVTTISLHRLFSLSGQLLDLTDTIYHLGK